VESVESSDRIGSVGPVDDGRYESQHQP
jgi:hypothetical protein